MGGKNLVACPGGYMVDNHVIYLQIADIHYIVRVHPFFNGFQNPHNVQIGVGGCPVGYS